MPSLNRVLLMGNMTREPELRYMPDNTPVVKFGLAINRRWKNQAGEQQEEVLFLDCDAFRRTAEVIQQYFHKGDPIFVEGRLKMDEWQDKEGNKRSKIKILVEGFEFIKSRGEGGGEEGAGSPQRNYSPRPTAKPASAPNPGRPVSAAPAPPSEPHQAVEEEDIPF